MRKDRSFGDDPVRGQTTGSFHGSRCGRDSIFAASSSPMIRSVRGSHFSDFRPSRMAMLPRWAIVIDRCADLHRRRRRLPRDHAVDEVAEVVVALVQVNLVRADLRVEDRFRVGRELAAVGRRSFPSVPSKVTPILFRFEMFIDDAVLVDAIERVLGGRVPERVGRELALHVAELDRAGQLGAHAPLGAVGMMPAPVGHLAAGVVEDPSEVDVAARGGVRRLGGRAEPASRTRSPPGPARASCGRRTWPGRDGPPGRPTRTVFRSPIRPLRTSSQARRNRGSERCWEPVWKTTPVFWTA